MNKDLIYLASPYSSDDPEIREYRFQAVARCAAHFLKKGIPVFSPIVHSHPISKFILDEDMSHQDWIEYDYIFEDKCSVLFILKDEGWLDSKGIALEVSQARDLKIPVYTVDPYTYQLEEFEL